MADEAIDVDAEYDGQQQQRNEQQGFAPAGSTTAPQSLGARDPRIGYHTVNATGGAINYSDALQKAAIYVNRIKHHFANRPEAFRQFLELLRLHKTNMIAVQDVYNDVSNLLAGSQDLLSEFSMFLPEVIRCSINSQLGEIRADNVEAWVSEAAPAFPICVVFVAPKGPLHMPKDFDDLVAHMRGAIAFAILDVNLQAAVGHAMLNASRRDMRAEAPSLPVWKLYHKGMHCAEASGWPTGFTLQNLLTTHSRQYGWKAITASNGERPALQPGRTLSSHSSAFKPAASGGRSTGGAFSAVGTGKMSLNNMLSGGDGAAAAGDGIGASGRDSASPTGDIHETSDDREAWRQREKKKKKKKKKRKREKKEKRKDEKRARKEAAQARTAVYSEMAAGGGAAAEPEDGEKLEKGAAAAVASSDGGAAAEAASADASKAAEEDADGDKSEDSQSDEDEKEPSNSHIVQSTNARGRPQRSAAVAAEAVSAGTNAKTDREARREEKERRALEKAAEPPKEKKPDAKSLRLAGKALYFTPGKEFFHCRTGAVIRRDEANLVDSDDEVDTTWIQKQNEVRKNQHAPAPAAPTASRPSVQAYLGAVLCLSAPANASCACVCMQQELMDEFEDVSKDEKAFMKMWNDFMKVRHRSTIAAPAACFRANRSCADPVDGALASLVMTGRCGVTWSRLT